jgi:hypothetical protein
MKRIAGFFEDGYVMQDDSRRFDQRYRLDFRGQTDNVYLTSAACANGPVGTVDLEFGVSPDPQEPIVSRFASVYGRTLGEPTQASGFKTLGTLRSDSSKLVLERICCQDKWIASKNDIRGYEIWQAEEAPNRVEFDPLPEQPAPEGTTDFFGDYLSTLTDSKNTTRNLIIAAVAIVLLTLITVKLIK